MVFISCSVLEYAVGMMTVVAMELVDRRGRSASMEKVLSRPVLSPSGSNVMQMQRNLLRVNSQAERASMQTLAARPKVRGAATARHGTATRGLINH